jgi:hypothetical protein
VNVVTKKDSLNLLHTVLKTKTYLTCIVGYTDLLLSSRPAARDSSKAMRLSSVTRKVKTETTGENYNNVAAQVRVKDLCRCLLQTIRRAVGSLRFAA